MNIEDQNNNSYNNADSFAMAFDEAWKENDNEKNKKLSLEKKIEITLIAIKIMEDEKKRSRFLCFGYVISLFANMDLVWSRRRVCDLRIVR